VICAPLHFRGKNGSGPHRKPGSQVKGNDAMNGGEKMCGNYCAAVNGRGKPVGCKNGKLRGGF